MASLVTTTANSAKLLRNWFADTLQMAFETELLASDLCNEQVVPLNSGVTVEFHRIQHFAKQTAAITQSMGSAHSAIHTTGGTLKGRGYTVDSVVATLELIGNDLELSELLMMTSEPNPVPTLSKRFLYNGSDSVDQKAINAMVSSSANGASNTATVPSVDYNGSSVSVSTIWGDGSATLTEATLDADIVTHLIAAESFNRAYGTLRANRVPFHPKIKPGRYVALIAPQQGTNLKLDATFQELALRGNAKGEDKFEGGLIGDVYGVYIMESPNVAVNFPGTIDATNDEIFRAPIFGDEYIYRVSHAKGMGKPRVSFVPPTPSAGDVYGNNAYLAWKCYGAWQVCNPIAGLILKTASTNQSASASGSDAEWQ